MIYLYLTKRDKKDVKLVTMFQGSCPTRMRVADVGALDLPPAWERELARIAEADRMHYELWMEEADDVLDLQKTLKGRGLVVPTMTAPLTWLSAIPTGLEDGAKTRLGNYAPAINPIAVKKMHIAHVKLLRTTP